MEHSAVWNALEEQKVPKQYVNTLKKLYEGQSGTVVANHESQPFGSTRGTKQGDPISPPLFNAVLEKAMARVKGMWLKRGWGIQMGSLDGERLLNLRFADDILLVSRSLRVLKRMLEELQIAVREVGLELHFGKTKILANEQGRKQSHATSLSWEEGKLIFYHLVSARSILDGFFLSWIFTRMKSNSGSPVDGLSSHASKSLYVTRK